MRPPCFESLDIEMNLPGSEHRNDDHCLENRTFGAALQPFHHDQ